LGEALSIDETASLLDRYGYWVKKRKDGVEVTCPPYRDDLMHPMDVIEDVAVSRGYDRFEPVLPSAMTVGGLSTIERFSDRIREGLVGMGFQEIISNILVSRDDVLRKMRLDGRVVEVDNIMSENYSVLRPSILPSLLGVEAASGKSFYPHRVFEAGETAVYDERERTGSRTVVQAAVLSAHAQASFSETHSFLEMLMYYLAVPYHLKPIDHPTFIAGRVGEILIGGEAVGRIGEIHPAVLEAWEIHVPCAALELDLDRLMALSGAADRAG
jgi:phenylalanyl-tRNA synthetase beta chain